MSEYTDLNKGLQSQMQTFKAQPIGVPLKPKRKPTRYEVQRRIDLGGLDHPTWEQLEVIPAASARAALTKWAEAQEPDALATDNLNVTLRAIPVSRITQSVLAVEQRSTLTFS